MNSRWRVLGTTLVLALVAAAGWASEPAKNLTDAEMTKLIVGKWHLEQTQQGVEIKVTDTFRKDGTFSGEAKFSREGQTRELSVTGKWKVADGVLIETIETCKPPVIKKGKVSKDQILSVTDKELKVKNESGEETVSKRVAE